MPSEAVVRFTAQDAAVITTLKAINDQLGAIGSSAGKVNSATDIVTGAFQKLGGVIKSTLSGKIWDLAFTALDEFEQRTTRTIERLQGVGQFAASLAKSERGALRSLEPGGDIAPEQLRPIIDSLAAKSGAKLETLYGAIPEVLASRGQFSQREALNQLSLSARLEPEFSPRELARLTSSTLDVRSAFGGTDQQALGALLAAARSSHAADLGTFADTAVPALINLGKTGEDFREAAAMLGTIANESGDTALGGSASSLVQFHRQIQQATDPFGQQGKSLSQRIDWLLSPEGEPIRRGLVGSFDAQAQTYDKGDLTGKQLLALKGLLVADSPVRAAYQAQLDKLPDYGTSDTALQAVFRDAGLGTFQGADAILRQGMAGGEAIRTMGDEGRRGAALTALEQMQQDLGSVGRERGKFWIKGDVSFLGMPVGAKAREKARLLDLMNVGVVRGNPFDQQDETLPDDLDRQLFPDHKTGVPLSPEAALSRIYTERLFRMVEQGLTPETEAIGKKLEEMILQLRQLNQGVLARIVDDPATRDDRAAQPRAPAR